MILWCLFIVWIPFVKSFEPQLPSFSSTMQNATVVAGRDARMTCVVENLMNYKVAWVHYGESGSAVLTVGTHVLTTNRRVSVVSERDSWTLVVANTTTTDRGDYMCQISTVPPKKMYAVLNVQVPPHISRPPLDIAVNEGETVELNCEAVGDPMPRITWRREDGSYIFINGTPVESVKGTLTIASVTKDDRGPYLCVASNGVPPAVSARAQLFVNFAPLLERDNKDVSWALVGQSTQLVCHYHSYPKPNITWTQIENPKRDLKFTIEDIGTDEGRAILFFRTLNHQDFGNYKCSVQNTVSQISIIMKLKEIITTTQVKTTPTSSVVDSAPSHKIRPSPSHKPSSADMQLGQKNKQKSTFSPEAIESNGRIRIFKNGETNPPKRFIQDSLLNHHDYQSQIEDNSSIQLCIMDITAMIVWIAFNHQFF